MEKEDCLALLVQSQMALGKSYEIINNYKEMVRIYNKALLVVFNWLKEAEKCQNRFDDPHFVDNEIKRLERELYRNI